MKSHQNKARMQINIWKALCIKMTDAYLKKSVWLRAAAVSRTNADLSVCASLFNIQLEMRSQDRQLAQTLLGLNTEIQRLRRESGPLLLDSSHTEQH